MTSSADSGSGFDLDDLEELLFGDRDDVEGADEAAEGRLVAEALRSGQRDPGDLANLVFFARHPERDGAPISPAEPGFEALRDEWLRIRDRVVAPIVVRAAEPDDEGAPATGLPSGTSTVARPASQQWTGPRRPEGWQRSVYGLVVHQMGGALPCNAVTAGADPVQRAVEHYVGSHGTHYVCGWGGIDQGELLQVADEHVQANGVAMTEQRSSVQAGTWEDDLPTVLVEHWRQRWPGETDPMALLPGTQTANAPYVHLEMVAAVVPWCDDGNGLPGEVPPPMREGLRYTREQHDAIVEVALDMARRHGWTGEWWNTSRLVGHEDLSPITRHDRAGGWDPGGLREEPWFDWTYVRDEIARLQAP